MNDLHFVTRLKKILFLLTIFLMGSGVCNAEVPTFLSIFPENVASTVGTSQTVSLSVSDESGFEHIAIIRLEIQDASGEGTTDDTVILEYWANYNKLVMYNHDDGRYRGSYPGNDVIVQDDLCEFDVSLSSVEGSGNELTIDWHITPFTAFAGEKVISFNVLDYDRNRLRIRDAGYWTVTLGQSYELTIGASPEEGGTTFPVAGAHFFQENESVTVIADSDPGYRFVSWSGDVSDPDSPATNVIMDSDKTVTANFETVPTYDITIGVSPSEGGYTSPEAGVHSYDEDEVVFVSAIANVGYRFVEWTGEVSDPLASDTTVAVDTSKSVVAVFEAVPTYTLTIDVDAPEAGTTYPEAGGHQYSDGEEIIVTATPNDGYRFVNWTGDVSDPDNSSTTVTVDSTKTIVAVFEPLAPGNTFTVDFNFANVGDITYQRIGVELPFEITRDDFVDAGFNTLLGNLFNVTISHMHNQDKADLNPEEWILQFDDGSGVAEPILVLSYSATEFIEETPDSVLDLSGTNWKFVIIETSDDGPYDRDRLFLDLLKVSVAE